MNRNFTTAIAVLAGVAAFTVLGNATVFKPAVNAPESKTMINASKMPARQPFSTISTVKTMMNG